MMMAAAFTVATSPRNGRATLPQRKPPTLDDKIRAATHVFVGVADRVAFVDPKNFYREPFEIFDAWAEGRATTLLVRVATPLMPEKWTEERLIRVASFGVSPSNESPLIGQKLIYFVRRNVTQLIGQRPFVQYTVPSAGEGLRAVPEELNRLDEVKGASQRRRAEIANSHENKTKAR
jgi:hypothetical protein